jgi:hypothetical protein
MGFRFRRIIGLLPGIRLNLGKKGASVWVGTKGLTANISKHGIRETVSLHGTGLSYSTYQKHPETSRQEKDVPPSVLYGVIFGILAIATVIVILVVMLTKYS